MTSTPSTVPDYTTEAGKVLRLARALAQGGLVSAWHLLIALSAHGGAQRVLAMWQLPIDDLAEQLRSSGPANGQMFTADGERVVRGATSYARELGHVRVGTSDFLLAVLEIDVVRGWLEAHKVTSGHVQAAMAQLEQYADDDDDLVVIVVPRAAVEAAAALFRASRSRHVGAAVPLQEALLRALQPAPNPSNGSIAAMVLPIASHPGTHATPRPLGRGHAQVLSGPPSDRGPAPKRQPVT